eukprot:2170270-Amphidinium_carterae.1
MMMMMMIVLPKAQKVHVVVAEYFAKLVFWGWHLQQSFDLKRHKEESYTTFFPENGNPNDQTMLNIPRNI